MSPLPAKNATEIVILCENALGYTHKTHTAKGVAIPLWKLRSQQARALKIKIAEKPFLYTWHNLELAVEYCKHKRLPLKSVAGLCWYVPDAVALAVTPEVKLAVSTSVEEAMQYELANPDLPDQALWLRRLVRAQGRERLEVLKEWEEVRGRVD